MSEELLHEPRKSSLVSVEILPDSPEMEAQSVLRACQITKREFTIGRRSSRRSSSVGYTVADHLIAEKYPYTISREHCEIERLSAGVIVRDLSSRLGTLVNGVRLRVSSGYKSEVTLGLGQHSLVLGKRDGVIRFRLLVSESSEQST